MSRAQRILAVIVGLITGVLLMESYGAMVHEVDAATLDTLDARVRATGSRCRHCWRRIRRGEPALRGPPPWIAD